MAQSVGIAFPIRYRCNYPDRKTAEMNLYFSDKPITKNQVDLVEPGNNSEKAKRFYLKWNVYGEHDCLVPVKVRELARYQSTWGVNGGGFKPILNKNLITQSQFEYMELMPCMKADLPDILASKAVLDFYFTISEGNFWLNIKDPSGAEGYITLPAQRYCPECWHGFAHSVITLESKVILPSARRLVTDIPWTMLLDEMNGREVKMPEVIPPAKPYRSRLMISPDGSIVLDTSYRPE
jgi:hypothetical protein